MKRVALTVLLAALAGALIGWFMPAEAAAPPIRPEQPHPDQFADPTYGNLAQYSTLYLPAKTTRTASYRLVTKSGCLNGTIPNDLRRLEAELSSKVSFRLVRNDASYQFTVFIDCGSEQIAKCGGVNIFCLPDGFPYNNDVYISDVLSTYQENTRLAILCHEICGHAIQVAAEQYCFGASDPAPQCEGLPQFTPAPTWPDLMNTGELSRHGIEEIECGRWMRVMYEDVPCAGVYFPTVECAFLGFDSCSGRFRMIDAYGQPISYDPNTGVWWNKFDEPEWGACYTDGFVRGLRPNLRYGYLAPGGGTGDFILSRSYWTAPPPCS